MNEDFLATLLRRRTPVATEAGTGMPAAVPTLDALQAAAIAVLRGWKAEACREDILAVADRTATEDLRRAALAAADSLAGPKPAAPALSPDLAGDLRAIIENPSVPVRWRAVEERILGLSRTPASVTFLTALLLRTEPVRIVPGDELPGVMPPLEMWKCAALRAAARGRDAGALPAIEWVERSTTFSPLRHAATEAAAVIRSGSGGR